MNIQASRHAPARWFKRFFTAGAFFFLSLITGSCVPARVPEVIKIGLVAPFEGAYRAYGYDAIYAARLAVREINAASVSEGWALELVAYDDRAEPDMARASARNLVTDSDVLAVIGHFTGGTTTAASDIYTAAELPLMVIGEGPESPSLWHLAPSPQRQAEAILETITHPSFSTAVWGEGWLASELSQQLSAQNMHLISTGPENVSTIPEFVISTLPPLQTGEYLRIWSEKGWQGHLIGTAGLHTSSFALVSGEWRDRACFITPYPLTNDLPNIESWKKAYSQTGPHVPEPGAYALPTYEAVRVLAQVIDELRQDHKALTRQQLNTALAQARHTGKLGVMTWDAHGYWNNAPLYHYCWEGTPQLVQLLP